MIALHRLSLLATKAGFSRFRHGRLEIFLISQVRLHFHIEPIFLHISLVILTSLPYVDYGSLARGCGLLRGSENFQTSWIRKTARNILILVYLFGLRVLSVVCTIDCFEWILALRIDGSQIAVA